MDTDVQVNITDLQLRNLAAHIPPEKCLDLALSLGLTKTDLAVIDQSIVGDTGDDDSDTGIIPIERTFRVLDRWRANLDPFLIRWRNKVDGRQTERVKLETALRSRGLETFLPCIDAYVTRKESDTEDTHPTINLSLPNGATDADTKQEIEILAVFSGANADVMKDHYKQLYRLISHPAKSSQNWNRICRIKSVFEPECQVTNIELLPLCFTVDVVSLPNLDNLSRSIQSECLASSLRDALISYWGDCRDGKAPQLKLELDKTSFNEAVRFFKDLNTSIRPEYHSPRLASDDIWSSQHSHRQAEGFDPWASAPHDMQTPESTLPDSARQQKGASLVWRNVAQQNFGF